MSKNHLNSLGANFPSCIFLFICGDVIVWMCGFVVSVKKDYSF